MGLAWALARGQPPWTPLPPSPDWGAGLRSEGVRPCEVRGREATRGQRGAGDQKGEARLFVRLLSWDLSCSLILGLKLEGRPA